jgi:hypothetical protein
MYGEFSNDLVDNIKSSRAKKIRNLASEKLPMAKEHHKVPRCRQITSVKECKATGRGVYKPCKVVKMSGNDNNAPGKWFCDYTVASIPGSKKKFSRIVKNMKNRGQDLSKGYRKWGRTFTGMAVPKTRVRREMTKGALKKISEARIKPISVTEVGSNRKSTTARIMQCDLLTPKYASSSQRGMRNYADECRRSAYCELVNMDTGKPPRNLTNLVLRKKTMKDLSELRCAPSEDLGPIRQYSLKYMKQKAKGKVPYISIPRGHPRDSSGRLVMYELDLGSRNVGDLLNMQQKGLVGRVSNKATNLSARASNAMGFLKDRIPFMEGRRNVGLGHITPLELEDRLLPCSAFTVDQCPTWPSGPKEKRVSGRRGVGIPNPYRDIKRCRITASGCSNPSGDDSNPFSRYYNSLRNKSEYNTMTKGIHDEIVKNRTLPMKQVDTFLKRFEDTLGYKFPGRLRTFKDARDLFNRIERNAIPDELRNKPRANLATAMTMDLLAPIVLKRTGVNL